MLSYEINKNAAVSQKTSNADYQFERVEKEVVKKLLVIGETSNTISNHLSKFNYKFDYYTDITGTYSELENLIDSSASLPCAIICDIDLTDGKAFDLIGKLNGNSFLNSIPFIIISKNGNDEDKKKAKEIGADDFYTVPFEIDDLNNRINFLHQYKKEKKKINVSQDFLFENKTSLLKRSFDLLLSTTALILLSPLLLLVALIIKLESKGPAIYVSKRVGTGYNIFDLYKFRSMKQGADVQLKKLMHLNQYGDEHKANEPSFVKLENDPRVTKFGRFIRATSIDELPQLFNVIKGDMSIVGNRPLPLYEAEQLTKDVWAKRFLAPAGLTGLWQVSRRGNDEMSVSERVILDNTYADRHSFWLDIKIILKTFPALISKIHS